MMVIFHLEDDQFLPEIFQVAIQAANPKVEIIHHANSDDALANIKDNWESIKVYVLDIRVPGSMNGIELAEKIREFDPDTPMFISSAYRKPEAKTLHELNAQWMSKPMELVSASRTILPLLYN